MPLGHVSYSLHHFSGVIRSASVGPASRHQFLRMTKVGVANQLIAEAERFAMTTTGLTSGCQLPWTNTFDDSITLSTESVCSGDDHVGLITLITSCLRSRQSIVIHFYSVICPSPASESEAHHDGKLETRLSVYSRCGQCQRVQFSNHDWKHWTVEQNDS